MIIIPTYKDHFNYAVNLLKSADNKELITLVFSSKDEMNEFKLFGLSNYKSLIIESGQGHPVLYKKFEALKILNQEGHEYIATIDDECLFRTHITPHLKEIWNNNPILANECIDNQYLKYVIQSLDIEHYHIPDNLYWWFNQIPVYKSEYLLDFFNWLNKKPNYGGAFDYLIFGIYLITEHKWKPKMLNRLAHHGLVEADCQESAILSQTNWSCYSNKSPDNIYMHFHLDRYSIK